MQAKNREKSVFWEREGKVPRPISPDTPQSKTKPKSRGILGLSIPRDFGFGSCRARPGNRSLLILRRSRVDGGRIEGERERGKDGFPVGEESKKSAGSRGWLQGAAAMADCFSVTPHASVTARAGLACMASVSSSRV